MASGQARRPRSRPRILVAEDDFVIGMDLEELLADEGWEVIGPAATVEAALARIEEAAPDAAVLDVDLGGERVGPVAKALRARGVPFLLVSGYTRSQLTEEELAGAPRVSKPFEAGEVVRAVREMLA